MPKAKKNLNLPEENPATKRYTHTFSVPPAICLSEPYNDKDSLKRPAHKGKQFQLGKYHGKDAFTTVASEAFEPGVGYLPSSLFQMMPSLTSAVDMKGKAPFQEVERYKDKFKGGEFRPKGATRLGFMSGDYPKRDEYSNVVSTERLRETIRKEDTLSKKQKHARDGEEGFEDEGMLPEIDARRRSTLGGVGGQTLFDVVHRVPDVSLKYKRDDRQVSLSSPLALPLPTLSLSRSPSPSPSPPNHMRTLERSPSLPYLRT